MMEEDQGLLFDITEPWEREWVDMPEFVQEDLEPYDTIQVHVRNEEDRQAFLTYMGEKPDKAKSIWYPKMEYLQQSRRDAPKTTVPEGRYPIFVITKGRWEKPLTSRALDKLGLQHYLCVEPAEVKRYVEATKDLTTANILALPENFSERGQGSIPVRNWVWEEALSLRGRSSSHWILDDNLDGFYRLNHNLKVRIIDENPFEPVERFSDRYNNIALAGLQYEFFASRRSRMPPYRTNTRIYSCILIRNHLPYRWRGRYNEDTDLSLRALKDGWATVLFNAYLCKKMPTMTMEGGNTDELYAGDGRLEMAQSLVDQHPDCVRISEKWGRYQHHVDYSRFKRNPLTRR